MRIEYSKKFIKVFRKCPKRVRERTKDRLLIFVKNQNHPILNNHPLIGKLKGCRSINITGDWRAVFMELDNGKIAHFVVIGTHSQLYS